MALTSSYERKVQVVPNPRQDAPKVGRPRDEVVETKIIESALTLYGEVGWAAFNLTKVASAAGVGKSSIYTRWETRDDLLKDAFARLVRCPGPRGNSAREVLMNEAEFRLREYLGPNRRAVRRLFVEAGETNDPTIALIHNQIFITPLGTIRTRLWEFKSAGQIKDTLSVTRLLDAVEGSVLMRTFCLPDDYIDCFMLKVPRYLEALIDDQLHGNLNSSLRAVS